jgi:hypothetical protein
VCVCVWGDIANQARLEYGLQNSEIYDTNDKYFQNLWRKTEIKKKKKLYRFKKCYEKLECNGLLETIRWKVTKGGEIIRKPGLVFPNGLHIEISEK